MMDMEDQYLIPSSSGTKCKPLATISALESIPSVSDERHRQTIVDDTDLASRIRGSTKKHWKPKKSRKPPKKAWWKFIFRLLFSHLGLFLLTCGYASFGAWIFIKIELPHEEYRRVVKDTRALEINDTVNYLAELFWYWQDQNYSFNEFAVKVSGKIRDFEHYVIQSVSEVGYDGEYGTWNYEWTFSKSLLFTVSTMATIGYGQITPKTEIGMIVLIVYSIVGIPLLMLWLANIGYVMAAAFKITYSRVACRWCRSRRKISEYSKGDESVYVPRSYRRVADDKVGTEEYMPTEQVYIPILLNLTIIAMYICIGGIIFSFWENWDYVESAYFTFVTLSTIGYGDYVPGRSFLSDDETSLNTSLRMLFTCFYCAFGMALVSMSITLMQEQIKAKIRWVAREVGLIKDEDPAEIHF